MEKQWSNNEPLTNPPLLRFKINNTMKKILLATFVAFMSLTLSVSAKTIPSKPLPYYPFFTPTVIYAEADVVDDNGEALLGIFFNLSESLTSTYSLSMRIRLFNGSSYRYFYYNVNVHPPVWGPATGYGEYLSGVVSANETVVETIVTDFHEI